METPVESVVKELVKIAKTERVEDACVRLRLIEKKDIGNLKIIPHSKWTRGGAETYILPFTIETNKRQEQYILKACIAFSPSPEGLLLAFKNWQDRRKLLQELSLRTPKLFGTGDAVILEELIPYETVDLLKKIPHTSTDAISLLRCGAEALGKILGKGFNPITLLSGTMSHGSDIVLIDYGTDLGAPYQTTWDENTAIDKLKSEINSIINTPDNPELPAYLRDVFLQCFRSTEDE